MTKFIILYPERLEIAQKLTDHLKKRLENVEIVSMNEPIKRLLYRDFPNIVFKTCKYCGEQYLGYRCNNVVIPHPSHDLYSESETINNESIIQKLTELIFQMDETYRFRFVLEKAFYNDIVVIPDCMRNEINLFRRFGDSTLTIFIGNEKPDDFDFYFYETDLKSFDNKKNILLNDENIDTFKEILTWLKGGTI